MSVVDILIVFSPSHRKVNRYTMSHIIDNNMLREGFAADLLHTVT